MEKKIVLNPKKQIDSRTKQNSKANQTKQNSLSQEQKRNGKERKYRGRIRGRERNLASLDSGSVAETLESLVVERESSGAPHSGGGGGSWVVEFGRKRG